MAQNLSSAVMHQRHEVHDSLDDFPTPPWATRAAIEVIRAKVRVYGAVLEQLDAREPCANRGYMARPLAEVFRKVIASDICDYGSGYPLLDYLFPGEMLPADFTFMNAPFNLCVDFILRSFDTPNWIGTAALVRTGFLEGGTAEASRYMRLFKDRPPTLIAQFCERVVMHKGVLRNPAVLYWDPEATNPKTGDKTGWWRKPSTATSYCWLFWCKGIAPQPFCWIAPCRARLERPGDYDDFSINRTGVPNAVAAE